MTLVKSAAKGDCYASISAHISGLSLPTFPAGFKNRFNVSLALKLVAFLALKFTSDCFVQLFLLSTSNLRTNLCLICDVTRRVTVHHDHVISNLWDKRGTKKEKQRAHILLWVKSMLSEIQRSTPVIWGLSSQEIWSLYCDVQIIEVVN